MGEVSYGDFVIFTDGLSDYGLHKYGIIPKGTILKLYRWSGSDGPGQVKSGVGAKMDGVKWDGGMRQKGLVGLSEWGQCRARSIWNEWGQVGFELIDKFEV